MLHTLLKYTYFFVTSSNSPTFYADNRELVFQYRRGFVVETPSRRPMSAQGPSKRGGTGRCSDFSMDKVVGAGNIRLLCVDFDQTLVTTHTQGRWVKSATELATFARPSIADLIRSSLDVKVRLCSLLLLLLSPPPPHLTPPPRQVPVAIVTSSMQVNLIRAVLVEIFGARGNKIVVKGMDDSWASPLYQNTPENWQRVSQWKMKPQNKKKAGKVDHFLSLAYEDCEKR